MMRVRLIALALLTLILPSCGNGERDLGARRVISSPSVSDPVDTTVTEATSKPAPSGSGTSGRSTQRPSSSARATRRETSAGQTARSLSRARVKLTRIATLSQPVAMATRRGDDGLYVAEKTGRVRVIRNGRVSGVAVVDVSSEISTGGEQGLLGLAFSPAGDKLYINFTNTDPPAGDTVVREYSFSGGSADSGSARLVLEVAQPFSNHNGGNLAFGPDGYLYIGLGDGGSGGDPQGNGQNLEALLGKMLRIDPRPSGGQAYRIPSSNPFVGRAGRDEIWAYGLRNPWRYSFDRSTGALWTADVGQGNWEEIDFQPSASKGGENYGWNRMEGSHAFQGSAPANHHGPIYEYSHAGGNCSVTGGYVYRGSRIPDLQGAYLFGDHCVGRLRAFVGSQGRATGHRFLGPQVGSLSSFGQDRAGELYVMSLDGGLYRIDNAS